MDIRHFIIIELIELNPWSPYCEDIQIINIIVDGVGNFRYEFAVCILSLFCKRFGSSHHPL